MDASLNFEGGHPFCFTLDPFAVVIIDVFVYCSMQIAKRFKLRFMAVEHFVFEGSEERFHYAIVNAIPFSGH